MGVLGLRLVAKSYDRNLGLLSAIHTARRTVYRTVPQAAVRRNWACLRETERTVEYVLRTCPQYGSSPCGSAQVHMFYTDADACVRSACVRDVVRYRTVLCVFMRTCALRTRVVLLCAWIRLWCRASPAIVARWIYWRSLPLVDEGSVACGCNVVCVQTALLWIASGSSGLAASLFGALASINEVNQRRARILLWWETVCFTDRQTDAVIIDRNRPHLMYSFSAA